MLFFNQTLAKTRPEEECCEGYTRNKWARCIPVCSDDCVHGTCVAPDQCKCQEGYGGPTCKICKTSQNLPFVSFYAD